MLIQKLPWAGIRAAYASTSVVIDPLYHFPERYAPPNEPMQPLDAFGPVQAVLVTHHHGDHFDPAAIARFYGADIPVYLPLEAVAQAREAGLTNVRGAKAGDAFTVGSMTATAAPSVDGVGDPQIAWIVQGGDRKLIHCGDTLWHAYWWGIAESHGPIDAACLPVNGALLELPGREPSGQPISMNPEQAVAAAIGLGAKVLVPIHYDTIHRPPIYRQTERMMDRLKNGSDGRIELKMLRAGETLTL